MAATVVRDRAPRGCFYRMGEVIASSERKVLYRGTYVDAQGVRRDALLVTFAPGAEAQYANELASLARNAAIGAGPQLLCPYLAARGQGSSGLALVEEYAGVSLERALFSAAPIPVDETLRALDKPEEAAARPRFSAAPLNEVGTPEREREAAKIAFDVMVQLANLHAENSYHRDLRAANVCVKRCGPEPEDLHATLIDFELAAHDAGERVAYANEPYTHLFRRLPAELGAAAPADLTPLQIDMGYLAALLFELATGVPATGAAPEDLRAQFGTWPLFAYRADGTVFARMIDQELDIDARAHGLGLAPVCAETFPEPDLLAMARATVRHGGYVDAYDRARLKMLHPEAKMYGSLDGLVDRAFRTYVEQASRGGAALAARTLDAQPEVLRGSTTAQVKDVPAKVYALGYRVVEASACPAGRRVASFTDDEVEYLAYMEHRRWCAERRAAGWTWGPAKDVEKRINPSLVPYDELSEGDKDYNRAHARDIPRLLALAGLAICR